MYGEAQRVLKKVMVKFRPVFVGRKGGRFPRGKVRSGRFQQLRFGLNGGIHRGMI